jgi:hypothetical protein
MLCKTQKILKIFSIVFMFIILLVIGAAIYQKFEKSTNYLDALFLMVMSATTIGTHKYMPVTSGGIWFFMLYSIILVTYFLSCVIIVFSVVLE